ncbi:phospholipase D-like domain-containing protein [Pontibacterium granulatum]|uniref:phospholipase D-like domain-containing protein n=1 Tax=Pontibacterium granulatum TaxID=2036029 RepID=UPI00249C6199|nr:phospholipase D-like domain-containing protein [Pontibacterium granulatum]MDI3323396.1 phospholipase D-like domain-containing protein [Pontibacterium granulatum]
MKFVANRINQVHLRDLLPTLSEQVQVDSILAAIAYGRSAADETKDLVGHAVANKLRLDLWMRYDHTVPVALPLLARLLRHLPDNIFTKFVPDCFHAKVIWWRGYGAYIGSANHTDRGWLTNVEAGVFLEEDELVASGMDNQLLDFFDYLRGLNNAIPISKEYVSEMERLSELNKEAHAKSKKERAYPIWEGPAYVSKKDAFSKRKERFRAEWQETLGILQSIQQQLPDYRPQWIDSSVPTAWQVDQFLHAYYYNQVGDNVRKPYEEYYEKNKSNPKIALQEQLTWWKGLSEAPTSEHEMLYEHAPEIKRLLDKGNVLELTVKDLERLFAKTHATKDHVIKIPMAVLGRPEIKSMDREGRLSLFAQMMENVRNELGWDVRQLLHYVLYGGDESKVWERLYHAGRDSKYSISRYGLNSIAEVVGWARPEVAPPRNGRTSKALRALGFDVNVY